MVNGYARKRNIERFGEELMETDATIPADTLRRAGVTVCDWALDRGVGTDVVTDLLDALGVVRADV